MNRGSSLLFFGGIITFACTLPSCGSSHSGAAAPTSSLFVVPASLDDLKEETFFEHPFPSDLRRETDGTVKFTGWPNPYQNALITQYITTTSHLLDGFSPAAPTFLRFSAPIDQSSLPADPPSSAKSDASVQLIDVDPQSPEKGQRRLVQFHVQETVTDGSYWQPNTLAVMPILGRELRPKTRYALVATSKLRAKDGSAIEPSADLAEVLGIVPTTAHAQAVHDLFAPAVAELIADGIATKDIVHLTVFTTADPAAEVFAVADDVKANVPPPTATDWVAKETTADYDVYEGNYGPSPNYQSGTVPYRKPEDGGGFIFVNGKPVLQNTFIPRFALVVPNKDKCPMPLSGYPIVIYAHGTGGDYRSFIDDATAQALAQQCLASIGTDQIFHGTRPGAPAADDPQRESKIELLFFNFDNAFAARTNNRQSSIDVVQEARLFTDTHLAVPATVATTKASIALDATKILFFGHSQGSLNGPLFLAASSAARGGILSGAGSVLSDALLEKTMPIDVSATVRLLLGLTDSERAAELSIFHPALALAQTIVDATDPIHYGPYITTTPRTGFAPKSIFQTEGIAADGTGDTYAPPHGIEALAVAMSLPRIAPGTHPLVEANWAGIADVTIGAEGVTGNIGGGKATGALAQFTPTAGSDGHFVVFDVPKARLQAATFCKDLAADPVGRLSPTP